MIDLRHPLAALVRRMPKRNTPDGIGRSLVRNGNLGGDERTAPRRLAGQIITEFLRKFIQYERKEMSDEDFQSFFNQLLQQHVPMLLGLSK